MTWRVSRVSGTAGPAWRVSKISGVLSYLTSTWRVSKISGSVTVAPVTNPGTPPVLALGSLILDPVGPTIVRSVLTGGDVPTSYVWTISAGTIVDNKDGTAITYPPGSPTGGAVTVTVRGISASGTGAVASVSATVTAAPGGYKSSDGSIHAISNPYTTLLRDTFLLDAGTLI